MLFRLGADATLLLHLAFVAFACLGGLLALRWRWAPWLHLPAAAWGTYVEVAANPCPLNDMENALRRAAGQSGYTTSFIEHYLLPLIYPPGLTATEQLALGAALLLLNVAVYGWMITRRRGHAAP